MKNEISAATRHVNSDVAERRCVVCCFGGYFTLQSKTKQYTNVFLDCFQNIFSNKFILGDACPPIHKIYLSFTYVAPG